MKKNFKKLSILAAVGIALGISASTIFSNFLYSKIIEEHSKEVIPLEEIIDSKITALNMCIQLAHLENKKIDGCTKMQHKIADDIYTKLKSMPYTKFYYEYIDKSNFLKEIDALKNLSFHSKFSDKSKK
ncbi:MAG: hypothetical protein ACNI25_06640 [Halarcobacter sp.]